MQISINRYPLQPKWPLSIDTNDGPYTSIREARESLQQNFIFLLQTIPGEWPMNPDLGVGLAKYLFEGYRSSELDELKSRLKNQLSKYLPSVKLVNAAFVHTDDDQDNLNTTLQITYSVDLLGVVDMIKFGLDTNTKTFVQVRPEESKFGRVL